MIQTFKAKAGLIALLLPTCGLLSAQMNPIEFEEYDLDNGMHVILHQDRTVPIVAVTLAYHVGSKNERSDRTGFAHFFEHLMFEGSSNIPRGGYFKMIEGIGGEINANTTADRTLYYEIVPSNYLEQALWMERERITDLIIDEEGVNTQRAVVKEERKQRYENQPYGSFREEMYKRAFKKHPYQWLPIGSAQYIDEANIEEFRAFHKLYYVPENTTLSIAGDIDIEQTKAWVKKYMATIPRGTQAIPEVTVVEPPLGGEIRDTILDNIQLPAVILGYRTPGFKEKDYYALSLLAQVLSQGESSRMTRNLVNRQQIALAAGSAALSSEDPGLTVMFAISNMGVSPDKLEEAMESEIAQMKNELITEEEFIKLRNQLETGFVNEKSSIVGIGSSLATYHMLYGDANLINTELDRYLEVTREDIKRVANTYLNKDNRVVLYYLPKAQN
jgi:predicted Zn-dependent peptidase